MRTPAAAAAITIMMTILLLSPVWAGSVLLPFDDPPPVEGVVTVVPVAVVSVLEDIGTVRDH